MNHPRQLQDKASAVDLLLLEGLEYYRTNEFAKALEVYAGALATAEREGDPVLLADIYYRMGRVHLRQQHWELSIQVFGQALTLLETSGPGASKAIVHSNIGIACQELGLADSARSHYLHALEIRRQTEDRPGEVRSLIDIGSTHLTQGRYTKALEYYANAQSLAETLKPEDPVIVGAVLTHMGSLYGELGDYQAALDYHGKALAVYEKVQDREGIATALHNIGYIYAERAQPGDVPLAVESFRRALSRREELRDPFGRAGTLNSLGFTLSEHGNPAEALPMLQEAEQVLQSLNARKQLAATLDSIGTAYKHLKDYPRALQYYGRSLDMWYAIGDRDGERITLGNIGSVMRLMDKVEQAILFYKMSVNISQEIRTEIKILPQVYQRSYANRVERLYRALADILIDEGRLAEAEQVLIMLKEEEFFNFMQRRSGLDDQVSPPVNYDDSERPWVERLKESKAAVISTGKESDAFREHRDSEPSPDGGGGRVQQEAQRKEEARAVLRFLEEIQAAFLEEGIQRAMEYGEKELKVLRQVQDELKSLGRGTVLIHTFLTNERLRVLLTTSSRQVPLDYPIARAEMNQMIQVFRQRLQDPQSDPLSQAQLLYHCLIAPLDDELSRAGASTLLISLDDTLRYLPFAALHDGTRYLCERYRIVVYTAAARRHLATPPGSSWKVAGLGVSEASGSGFRPLPGVRGELDSIIREEGTVDQTGVFPGVVHLDNRFTSSQLRADLNAGYPVVHIASHFKFQPGSKTDSFLLLGDGQRLSFDDFQIEDFRFSSVDLLTLSACETAFGGRDAHGREIESFGVLAQQLGAKAVLATLWQVEDMSTAEFMANFYRYRQKGLSKIEALQEAQLAFIREPGGPLAAQNRAVQDRGAVPVGPIAGRQIPPAGPPYSHPYSHPYYWAPFILMGNFL